MSDAAPHRASAPPRRNWLEWTVLALSLILIAGVVGTLAREAIGGSGRPPAVDVRVGAPTAADGGRWQVPVVLRNTGDRSARNVTVELVVRRGAPDEARATVLVSFLPAHSVREGTAAFGGPVGRAEVAGVGWGE